MPFHFCSRGQLEIGFKIDAVEAVAMKLLQRLNYSASVMKTSAAHLEEGKIAFFRICILFELSRSETPNLYTQLANLTQMAYVLQRHSYLCLTTNPFNSVFHVKRDIYTLFYT
jgi:hypothetical protein